MYIHIIVQLYLVECCLYNVFIQYVEDPRFEKLNVDPITVLHQSVKGLAFLHSIGISKLSCHAQQLHVYLHAPSIALLIGLFCITVHRDIKPRNVLLSFPSTNGQYRAMISDFGLCRKLPMGKVSITAKSGVAGTEGWMAPEIFDNRKRVVS